MKITAIITREPDGGYSAEIAEMPGCFTQGDNMEELKVNIKEAAEC